MELPELGNSVKSSMVLYILITFPNYSPDTPRNFKSDICLWIFVSKCCTSAQKAKYTFAHKDQRRDMRMMSKVYFKFHHFRRRKVDNFHFLGFAPNSMPRKTFLLCPLSWTKQRNKEKENLFGSQSICVFLLACMCLCVRLCLCLCVCVLYM